MRKKGFFNLVALVFRLNNVDRIFVVCCREWAMQRSFIQGILNNYEQSVRDGATKVMIVMFSHQAKSLFSDFSADFDLITSKLNSYKRMGGGTLAHTGIELALAKLQKPHHKSRLNDVAVKKMVFFLTDGATGMQDAYLKACALLKKVHTSLISCIRTRLFT